MPDELDIDLGGEAKTCTMLVDLCGQLTDAVSFWRQRTEALTQQTKDLQEAVGRTNLRVRHLEQQILESSNPKRTKTSGAPRTQRQSQRPKPLRGSAIRELFTRARQCSESRELLNELPIPAKPGDIDRLNKPRENGTAPILPDALQIAVNALPKTSSSRRTVYLDKEVKNIHPRYKFNWLIAAPGPQPGRSGPATAKAQAEPPPHPAPSAPLGPTPKDCADLSAFLREIERNGPGFVSASTDPGVGDPVTASGPNAADAAASAQSAAPAPVNDGDYEPSSSSSDEDEQADERPAPAPKPQPGSSGPATAEAQAEPPAERPKTAGGLAGTATFFGQYCELSSSDDDDDDVEASPPASSNE